MALDTQDTVVASAEGPADNDDTVECQTIDRYVILGTLGRGAMGTVYRARDPRLLRNVALKVLGTKPDPSSGVAPGAKGLLREARAVAAFDHPNAVQVFDVGVAGGVPFIAMEFVAGRTLRSYVGDESVPTATRLRWLCDAARALAAAHRAGIVHRDVKPDNVMVRDDGVVKVLDFGLARRLIGLANSADGSQVSGAKAGFAGTPMYMAPEQVRCEQPDSRADQFAWGVMAYEILTGSVPWRSSANLLELIEEIQTLEVTSLPARGSVPPAAAAAVLRALHKDKEERFASMDEIVAALEPPVVPSLSAIALDHASAGARTTPASLTLRAGRAGRSIVAGALAAAVLAVLAVVVAAPRLRGTAPFVSPSASAGAPAPTSSPAAVTDRPPPPSTSPQAAAAFVAGMQNMRDGAATTAIANFQRAVDLDPSLAVAHLRLALFRFGAHTREARESFQKAVEQRASLDERDRGLLDAFEPIIWRDPPDNAAASARLASLEERYPRDAEIRYFHGLRMTDDVATSVEVLDRALAADPHFALALWNKGQFQAYLGDIGGAIASLRQCLDVSPAAFDCLNDLVWIRQEQGLCATVEADARRMIAMSSEVPEGYAHLASAIYTDASIDAARDVLAQKATHTPPSWRRDAELTDAARLAILAGDFEAAERRALELTEHLAKSSAAEDHARPARMLVELYTEQGRLKDAARVAGEYLSHRKAWYADARAEDFAMAKDPTVLFLRAQVRAGDLSPSAFATERDAWVRAWEARAVPSLRSYLWFHEYAVAVDNEADAMDALAALPRYAPLPIFRPLTLAAAWVGKTYFLGGRLDEALEELERASRSCVALEHPIEHTHANLWLGIAREAKGDTAGACAAYGVVVKRWGKVKPRSVSATRAAAQAAKLGCRP